MQEPRRTCFKIINFFLYDQIILEKSISISIIFINIRLKHNGNFRRAYTTQTRPISLIRNLISILTCLTRHESRGTGREFRPFVARMCYLILIFTDEMSIFDYLPHLNAYTWWLTMGYDLLFLSESHYPV